MRIFAGVAIALGVACACSPWLRANQSPRGNVPSLSITPSSGGLGSVVTITVAPSTPEYELNSFTTARWEGVYDAPIGPDSTSFSVDYAGDDIVIVNPWTARILIGGGTVSQTPDVQGLMPGGSLAGNLMLSTPPQCVGDADFDADVDFDDLTAVLSNWGVSYGGGNTGPGDASRDGNVDFDDVTAVLSNWGTVCAPVVVMGSVFISLNTSATEWYSIDYPDGYGGLVPPQLGPAAPSIFIHRNSLYVSPSAPPAQQLSYAVSTHYAVALRVAESALSLAAAPTTISVDLRTLDASGVEIDREVNVALTRMDNDNDPAFITYVSDLTKPIIVIDQAVNQASYPGFHLLLGTLTGRVGVVPPTR